MKFSMRTLLVAVTGVCCLLSLGLLVRENRLLKQANTELRNTVGEFEEVDENKLYTNEVSTLPRCHWAWRIHIPKSTRYALCLQTKDVPYPERKRIRLGERLFDLPPGHHSVAVCVKQNGDHWDLLIVCDDDWVIVPFQGEFLKRAGVAYAVPLLTEGSAPRSRVDLCARFDLEDQPAAEQYRNGLLLWLDRTL